MKKAGIICSCLVLLVAILFVDCEKSVEDVATKFSSDELKNDGNENIEASKTGAVNESEVATDGATDEGWNEEGEEFEFVAEDDGDDEFFEEDDDDVGEEEKKRRDFMKNHYMMPGTMPTTNYTNDDWPLKRQIDLVCKECQDEMTKVMNYFKRSTMNSIKEKSMPPRALAEDALNQLICFQHSRKSKTDPKRPYDKIYEQCIQITEKYDNEVIHALDTSKDEDSFIKKVCLDVIQTCGLLDLYSEDKNPVNVKKDSENYEILSKKFMNQIVHEIGVEKRSSGLAYKVISPGDPNLQKFQSKDIFKIDYNSTYINGEVIDMGRNREMELSKMIDGIAEGIAIMNAGADYIFYIPHTLAYGDKGEDGVKANSALIFRMKLLPKVESDTKNEEADDNNDNDKLDDGIEEEEDDEIGECSADDDTCKESSING